MQRQDGRRIHLRGGRGRQPAEGRAGTARELGKSGTSGALRPAGGAGAGGLGPRFPDPQAGAAAASACGTSSKSTASRCRPAGSGRMKSRRADRCQGRNPRTEFNGVGNCGSVLVLSGRVDAGPEPQRGTALQALPRNTGFSGGRAWRRTEKPAPHTDLSGSEPGRSSESPGAEENPGCKGSAVSLGYGILCQSPTRLQSIVPCLTVLPSGRGCRQMRKRRPENLNFPSASVRARGHFLHAAGQMSSDPEFSCSAGSASVWLHSGAERGYAWQKLEILDPEGRDGLPFCQPVLRGFRRRAAGAVAAVQSWRPAADAGA